METTITAILCILYVIFLYILAYFLPELINFFKEKRFQNFLISPKKPVITNVICVYVPDTFKENSWLDNFNFGMFPNILFLPFPTKKQDPYIEIHHLDCDNICELQTLKKDIELYFQTFKNKTE